MLTWASRLKRTALVAGTCALFLCLVGVPAVAVADPLVVWCEPHKVQTTEELAKQWAKDTGIPVKVEPVSVLETANKVQLSGPLGKGPDVFCCLSGQLGMLVTTATVAPIDRSSLDLSNFMPVALEAATHGGKLYGIPYDVSTVALIYNKDLMPEPPATMNDLIGKSRELRKKGLFGVLWPLENFYYTYALMKGYGGYVFGWTGSAWDPKDIGLANAGSVKAIKLVKTLRDEGLIPVGSDHVVALAKFTEGKAAAIIDGSWSLANIKQAGIKYGVAPIPRLDNGKYPAPFVSLKWWHVSSYSKRKGDAVRFISYITSKDAMYKSFKNAEGIPPRNDVLNIPDVKASAEVAGFGAQADLGSVLSDIPEMNPVWVPMNNAIEIALRGEKTVEGALSDAVSLIKQSIAELK
ncbi:MAG: extracellular solute-binding protein [Bacillota bacterium]